MLHSVPDHSKVLHHFYQTVIDCARPRGQRAPAMIQIILVADNLEAYISPKQMQRVHELTPEKYDLHEYLALIVSVMASVP